MGAHALYCRGMVQSVRHNKEFRDNVSPEPVSNYFRESGLRHLVAQTGLDDGLTMNGPPWI